MMRLDRASPDRRAWLTPGTALAFSALVAWLGPAYEHRYGAALPAFTRTFLAGYAWWIAISFTALSLTAIGEQFPLAARWPAAFRALEFALTLASVLVIACGIIALFLPLLMRQAPD